MGAANISTMKENLLEKSNSNGREEEDDAYYDYSVKFFIGDKNETKSKISCKRDDGCSYIMTLRLFFGEKHLQ